MVENILRNSLAALVFAIVFMFLLWYPDFTGHNPTHLSLLLPVTGGYYPGSLFDSHGYRIITVLMAVVNCLSLLLLSLRFLSLGKGNVGLPLFYLLVIFSYPQARLFSTAFPSALFAIMGLYALFQAGEEKSPVTPLFISSFLSGCACLLYLPSLVITGSFLAIALTLSLLNGRNLFVFLGGVVLTLGGCLFCRYLFFHDLPQFLGTLFENINAIHLQFVPPKPATLFMTLVFLYLIGRAFLQWLRHVYGNQSYKARVLASFMWMFVICGIPLFLYADKVFGYLPLFALPSSILLAYYFSADRITRRMKVEFVVLLLSIILNQFAFFL